MSKFRTISLGLVMAAGPALAQDRPAVRLLPARAMDPVDAITARAAAGGGFEPFPNIPPPKNDGDKYRGMFEASRDRDEKPSEGGWTKFTKWMDDRAKAVKKAIDGPPEQQPAPRVGQTQRRPIFEPINKKPAANPDGTKVNAADPAYRWYGWGTATPGANQYAPSGDYPLGSAQWYNQTGATPGAFPVPTMNPYRPSPGSEPPTYGTPTIPAPPSTTPSPGQPIMLPSAQPIAAPSSRRTIAETPLMSPTIPQVAPAMPSIIGPSNQVPVPPSGSQDFRSKGTSQMAEPTWRPAGPSEPEATKPVEFKQTETNGLIIPVIRGAEPSFDDSPLAKKIHEACRGLVTDVTIRETGPGKLAIAFKATTATLAEIAKQATTNIIELKAYDVDFAVKLNQN